MKKLEKCLMRVFLEVNFKAIKMMNKYLAIVLSVTALGLVGCGEKDEPVYNVDYYKTHQQERVSKLDWCRNSADRKATTNCLNAVEAESDAKVSQMFGEGFSRT